MRAETIRLIADVKFIITAKSRLTNTITENSFQIRMARQLEFKKVNGWGGKRRGAGRPNESGQAGHSKRELINFKQPLHLTLKLIRKMPRLRTREFHRQFKIAAAKSRECGLHLNHYSLLNDHIHLIVEAKDNSSLSRGMKSLAGRLGKFVRKISGGQGPVWAGRFHLHVLRTPTEVKRALQYVMLNAAKHLRVIEHLDEFSSGYSFADWKALLGRRISGLMRDQLAQSPLLCEALSEPRSWLLRQGWKIA